VRLLTRSGLPVRSVTFDQGTEFAESEQMEKDLGIDVFYAHPRSPWERPTNENTNGLIRQFVPKRSKVSALTEDDINRFIAALNFRPRKCLGWKTPYEVAFNEVLHLT
jgi:IS30 family transposase